MNVLDLFSGIGGFSLGLERAGMRTIAFCESDPYCQRVLRKHWPDVPIYDDVRTLRFDQGRLVANADAGHELTQEEICPGRQSIDLICGGFPCQDISVAGKGAGIEGARSGLWTEFARIIGEVRPRYVIVENVAALLGRGIERVLGDLAALGFDAEWHCIPASAVGAPHRRDRIWIVAYAASAGADGYSRGAQAQYSMSGNGCEDVVPDARCQLLERWWRQSTPRSTQWLVEPNVGRVAHGVPSRVDRLKALANAVVPQIPEIIGRAIINECRQ
jgi:DNA (cytosine-5)-methyltransferase 1